MHVLLKQKYAKKIKNKKIKNALNMIASMYSRRCGSYGMYLEGDSPHQIVMIVCQYIRCSYISNRHNMRNLCTLVIFFTHNSYTFCYF